MKYWIFTGLVVLSCGMVQAVRVKEGLVVCIGADALESVSMDWKKPGCVFHCLETSDEKIFNVRKMILKAGCAGKVSAEKFDGRNLPYINNLVNQVISKRNDWQVSAAEIMRVLAPYGIAVINGKTIVKPYPKEMDEWPQYLHGPDNNCVADDMVAGPPRHVQWISGPAWTRAHIGAATVSSMVTAGGRLFTIEDRETAENPLLPAKWKLIARSAFNGIELWSKPYPNWEQVTVYIKNYHAQMQRRLVVDGDIVYCTPGLTAPITALDAASGKTLKTYNGTSGTQEFVFYDGVIYAVIGDRMHFFSYKGAPTVSGKSKKKSGREKGKKKKKTAAAGSETMPSRDALAFGGAGFPLWAYNPQMRNAEKPTDIIVAIDVKTGKELWRSREIQYYTGCSMALKSDRLVYQCTSGVFCLNAKTGEPIWSVEKDIPYGRGSAPFTLVLSNEAVYSEEGKKIFAYSLKDGSPYWSHPVSARKGYQASTDLLIADNALWMLGSCNNPKGTVLKKPTAFDLKTGRELRTLDQILSKPMGHDRCYRNFITARFFIDSKTGGPDCIEFKTGREYPGSFVRGTCCMGPLPANGLIYCGPWSCQCHLPTALHNFNAFYTDEASLKTQGQIVKVNRSVRLEKGPVYGWVGKKDNAPWPTYRKDGSRLSGGSGTLPIKDLEPLWETRFSGKISAPSIAGGKVFVAEVDKHLLHALDAATGKKLWTYIAGGRIDSPPSYYKGLLIFGSRDGWVQCVRASDGALAWRFKDLPDKLMCAFNQLESAWPVHGSVLIKNDTVYFCAGRTSFLDGGLFIYGLDPVTGKIKYQRNFYGPYDGDRFPVFFKGKNRSENEIILGTTADIMSSEGDKVYVRRQAFNLDLSDAKPDKHFLASAGMLEPNRNHREYKLVKEDFNHRKYWTTVKTEYPTGDIIVSNGRDYYSVFGVPVNRGTPFNARNGYLLTAKTRSGDSWSVKWETPIQITGKAMALAGKTVFTIGVPLVFRPDDFSATYKGKYGAVMLAVSAENGSRQAEYKLDKLPVWDGLAVGYNRLYIANRDGSIDCWGGK